MKANHHQTTQRDTTSATEQDVFSFSWITFHSMQQDLYI